MTQHTVGIADLTAGAGEITRVTIALGSCVAIARHDRTRRVGALAQILLSHHALIAHTPSAGKAASTAIPAMLSRMQALGGAFGCSVFFDVAFGRIQVRTVRGNAVLL